MLTSTGEDLSRGAACLVTNDSLFTGPACIDGCEDRTTLATTSRQRSSSDLGLLGRLLSIDMWPSRPHRMQSMGNLQSSRQCPSRKHLKQRPNRSAEISLLSGDEAGECDRAPSAAAYFHSAFLLRHKALHEGLGLRHGTAEPAAGPGLAPAGAPPAPVEEPADPDEPDNPRPETMGCSLEDTEAGLVDPEAMEKLTPSNVERRKYRGLGGRR